MNKEEYLQIRSSATHKISEANIEMTEAKAQYIEDNRLFKDGDRIKITTPEKTISYGIPCHYPETIRFAYVEKARCELNGDLYYDLYKEKKDGTPSKMMDYYRSTDILTLA